MIIEACSPQRTSAIENTALSAAITMSHAAIMPVPPPKQPPCTSATVGTGATSSRCTASAGARRARQLRLVAFGIHHAQKTERLVGRGAELVPGHRRHGDEIARLERLYLLADEAMAAPAQNQHAMHVLVPLQGGKAARRHLEIAQLARHLGIGEQHLTGNRLVERALVFL